MKDRLMEYFNKKYPVPKRFVRQSQRDKHDFNDLYIAMVAKRIKALRYNEVLPKKKSVVSKRWGFWVEVD